METRLSHEGSRDHRIRFVTKRWAHHSRHSGYDRIIDYVGSAIRPLDLAKLSSRWIPERVAVRFVERAGVHNYSMASFYDEWAAARDMIAHPRRAFYHVLYGDDSYRYLGTLGRLTRHRIVVSYHLPPDALRRRLRHTGHLRLADAIVVVGTNLVPLFSEWCGNERVHYVPHGVDTEVFRPLDRAEPSGADAPPRILCVGSHRRDFETLGAVIERMGRSAPDVRFVLVVGSSGESFRGHRNVEVRDRVPEPELIRLYQEAAVVLQPMDESTANNSILEGLACGVPVVATDVGGVRAYVDEQCAVLTPPSDAQKMVDGILGIIRDPARGAAMRRAARARALEFSWPNIASRLTELYRRLA